MDITTKLIELGFSRTEEEQDLYFSELHKTIILPDFEEKLFAYLYKHATNRTREIAARILRQRELHSESLAMNYERV